MEWLKKLLCIQKRRETRPYQNGGSIPPFVEEPLETEQEKKERWRSIYVIYFTMFQMSLGFSIVLTGVWPYLDRLEPGLGKQWLGWAVGAHPAGQLAAAPLLGLWANRGRARTPLLVTLVLAAVASILYSSLHLARPHARAVMMVARLLLGVSSANIAVARSYLSAASLVSERTRAVAGVSLAQVLGFVVGPALQAAAAPLGPGPAYPELGGSQPWFRFDMYTAPGWMNAVLALLNILLFLPWFFKDRRVAVKEAMRAQGKNEKDTLAALKPDLISSWTLVLAFFVLVFNFVLLETLATSLTMDQFGWDEKTALTNMGALMSAGAVLACAVFALISPLCKVIDERDLLLWGGFFMVGLASLMCIPWGPGPPPILMPAVNGTELTTGCPQLTQPWCLESRGLQLSQFLLGYTLVSVGYPIGVTLIQTIFSKVLGPRPQGVWMGILTGAGCLSRAVGPVFVSQVYAKFGPDATFLSTATLTLGTLVFMRMLYNRLKPKDLGPERPVDQEMRPLAADGKENGHV